MLQTPGSGAKRPCHGMEKEAVRERRTVEYRHQTRKTRRSPDPGKKKTKRKVFFSPLSLHPLMVGAEKEAIPLSLSQKKKTNKSNKMKYTCVHMHTKYMCDSND